MKTVVKKFKKFSTLDGRAISLRHHQNPYGPKDAEILGNSFKRISESYIYDTKDHYLFSKSFISKLNEPFKPEISLEQSHLKYAMTKTVKNTRTIAYQQTYLGIPVWRAGFNVRMFNDTNTIISSSSSVHRDVSLPYLELDEKRLSSNGNDKGFKELYGQLKKSDDQVTDMLQKIFQANKCKLLKVDKDHLVVFEYYKNQRENNEHSGLKDEGDSHHPHFKIGGAPKIEDGSHRLCKEIFVALQMPVFGEINWRIIIDLTTFDILYIRASYHNLDCMVFTDDPVRQSGDATLTTTSPATDLDPFRNTVELLGLNTPPNGSQQELDGEYISLSDFESPTVAPPTEDVGDNFNYSSITNDFGAVSAYYHLDAMFRLVEDFGFNVADYFAGTTFPIETDHRANTTNAFHRGNDASAATINFGFTQIGSVGYATDRAPVIHEFAHSCLQNNIADGVFSWCHGFGDALGVVLCDPASQAPDRFLRSPFYNTGAGLRRHDRDPAAGWAWGGTFDISGSLRRRQILSTTIFRAYQSTGGDDNHGNSTIRLARREFAAKYLAYLMIGAVGSMTATSPPTNAQDFAIALMDFDQTNIDFEGHPGGAFHKVIRWAFEKQGAFKIAGDAPDGPGSSPEIDVYIDDGRNGEYGWRQNFWNTTDIWSAQVDNSSVGHQTPLLGVTNYFFVRIKNRGQNQAENVVVKAYQCRPSTGLIWPVDWTPMDTPEISVGSLAAGAEIIVGPFEWTPVTEGHECILASVSADGDESNADTVNGDIPHWRLVPFDNNIAQRNVSPELPDMDGLVASLTNRVFWVNNPYKRTVDVTFDIDLPPILTKLGWSIKFNNANKERITLPPRGERKISFSLIPGKQFQKSDIDIKGESIHIITLIDYMAVGGMTYRIEPNLKRRLPEKIDKEIDEEFGVPEMNDIIECLRSKNQKIDSVRIKSIIIEVKMEDEC